MCTVYSTLCTINAQSKITTVLYDKCAPYEHELCTICAQYRMKECTNNTNCAQNEHKIEPNLNISRTISRNK